MLNCSEYVAMTTDIWTVNGYVTITVQFFDQLCSKVLMTAEMPERHTGIKIVNSSRRMGYHSMRFSSRQC